MSPGIRLRVIDLNCCRLARQSFASAPTASYRTRQVLSHGTVPDEMKLDSSFFSTATLPVSPMRISSRFRRASTWRNLKSVGM
jgi:hypothetical protein